MHHFDPGAVAAYGDEQTLRRSSHRTVPMAAIRVLLPGPLQAKTILTLTRNRETVKLLKASCCSLQKVCVAGRSAAMMIMEGRQVTEKGQEMTLCQVPFSRPWRAASLKEKQLFFCFILVQNW